VHSVERLDEGRERKAVCTALETATPDDEGALCSGLSLELVEQAGLSDAGLAGDDQARTLGATPKGVVELGKFRDSTNERRLSECDGHAAERMAWRP
jgi:hypothetical protein